MTERGGQALTPNDGTRRKAFDAYPVSETWIMFEMKPTRLPHSWRSKGWMKKTRVSRI
jgi:hypothetical protein